MSVRTILIAAAVAAAFGLAACGERPQVIEYKQGEYQGTQDQKAYASAPWNGNKTEWETAIRTRNQYQNEYKRTN